MIEISNKTRGRLDEALVKKVLKLFLEENRIDRDVSVVFLGDTAMRKLNKKYRGKDKATDILSFEGDDEFLGELVIDLQQIKRQAPKYSTSSREELIFILVHGLYHLLGYDDRTAEGHREMEILGRYFIKKHRLK